LFVVVSSAVLGPLTLAISPVLSMIPLSKPMIPVPPLNVPAETFTPGTDKANRRAKSETRQIQESPYSFFHIRIQEGIKIQ